MEAKQTMQATLGMAILKAANLDEMTRFYRDRVGLMLMDLQENFATLGAGGKALVRLERLDQPEKADGPRAGLYHLALLLPSRKDLARALLRLVEDKTPLQGVGDHGVSEALYLADPENNGIELYADRPKRMWPVDDIGRLQMDTDELDIEDLVMSLKGELQIPLALPAGTRLGHIHLQVSDLAATERFYTGGFGFEVTQRYGPAAIFMAAPGYHHHVGANTWAGEGLEPLPAKAPGLRGFEMILPDAAALARAVEGLTAAGAPVQDGHVTDPSGIEVWLKTQ